MPGTVVVNQPTVLLGDGSTEPVAVKPGFTPPVSADQALVVTLSPNSASIPAVLVSGGATVLAVGTVLRSSTALAPILKTAYTEQSSNFTGSIVSSSANDAAAGTGARTVRIYWMNAAGTTIGTEDVTLNGTTPVNLVTSTKCFIEKMEVLTVGSGGSAAGTISLKTGAGGAGTTVGSIDVGDNRTFWAHHYVQSGFSSRVTRMTHGNDSQSTNGSSYGALRARAIGVANAPERQVSDFLYVSGDNNTVVRTYEQNLVVPGPARITMYTKPSSNINISYFGSFDCSDQ